MDKLRDNTVGEKIKDRPSNRILLERTDNGVILIDLDGSNTVRSKIVYEIWGKDGALDFYKLAIFMYEIAEFMNLPVTDPEGNLKLEMYFEKIDPSLPSRGEKPGEEEKDGETDEP